MDDKSSQTKIGRVEQFMVGLLATPDHTPRLRVLRTKKIFEDLETDYRPTFELLHVATKELMMSRSLKELLHIILLTGNFINGSTKLGSAYGFRISSLQRLSNTLANVRRTSLNVNFLHFLVTVCERDCPRLLKFHTELPHLDDASRVSVEAVAEELGGWRKEVDELEEMKSQSGELQLGKDFISQLETFLPEANSILSSLLRDLDSVKRKGKELARYFCDDRDNFLEEVFLEIRNFSEEFGKTVKETLQENPIVLTPVGPVSPGNPPHSSPSPSPKSQLSRPGLSRATSLVTTHVLDLPPISEERGSLHDPSISPLALSSSGSDLTNPFVFPSNGFVKDDGGSPPIIMVAPPTDIVVTDVENDEERGGEDERSSRTQLKVSYFC
ncbi:Protein diaphanous homolog 1 [Geodia barretti]|uniref:Protein diaphanous homolog 1 n=1 Tax=Geodia barretti TaxID=519541 RepID=A0AA35TE01_GEOBA|nr:Protein diaphanous homolog 1 [Geodia barretti]